MMALRDTLTHAPSAALALLALCPLTVQPPVRQTTGELAVYDLDTKDPVQHRLPRRLREISGLATTPDERLFAHDDEKAEIYEIDPTNGDILKRFRLGERKISGDFEGIAFAKDRFYITTSGGTLLAFSEGLADERVPFELFRTDLDKRCEVEGLAFDPVADDLLLACKTIFDRNLRGSVVVFAVPLSTLVPDPEPRYRIPLSALPAFGLRDDFHPSGIEVHPRGESIFIVAARQESVVELGRSGVLIDGRRLRGKSHKQPEGIAFGPEGGLVLADEGGGGRARITIYHRSAPTTGGTGTS